MLNGIENIVVLSGGSGNDAILKALIDLGYSDANIRIIVNAYDDGKSTGVCREVTGTLGVSDIRKNHEKLHKMLYEGNINWPLINFYENRIDIETDYETGDALFDREIKEFFHRLKSEDFEYRNFNVMNIIYSQLYSSIGYEATNALFSDALGMDDVVKLNSFDNMKIIATTEKGNVITDEGDIVEWKNPDDKIIDIHFVGKSTWGLNPEAVKLINEADLIIISTGTFWSSLYPTLKYLDFYKYINDSKAKKLWVVNTNQDKDAYGVTAGEFFYHMENLGLEVTDFDILINEEADPLLKIIASDMDPVSYVAELGNIDGRNDPELVKKALKEIYGTVR